MRKQNELKNIKTRRKSKRLAEKKNQGNYSMKAQLYFSSICKILNCYVKITKKTRSRRLK